MFRKLLKYDMRSMLKLWLILSASALGLACICGLCFRGLIAGTNDIMKMAFMPFSMMGIFVSLFGIVAYVEAILIIIMVRFYRNFFSDEGYLTFTLPVKRSTLFNSKLLTAFIFNTGTLLNFLLCVIIILAITPAGEGGSALGAMIDLLRLELIAMGAVMTHELAAWITVFVILFLLLMIAMYIFSTMMIFLCVIFGSVIVKRLKFLMAIGLYYGASLVIEVISYILSLVLGFALEGLMSNPTMLTVEELPWLFLILLLGVISAIAIVCCFLYKFSVSKLRGNLNLA